MPGIFILILLAAIAFAVMRAVNQYRKPRVHDDGGKVLVPDFGAGAGRITAAVIGGFVLLILLAVSFRTVPVGHALVIFNVLTHGFRTARQGVTFVPPFIAN